MSEQEFHFLEAYAALCLKYGIIITTGTDVEPPFMCHVRATDIPLHIGQLFCPDPE